ncbi:MAG: deoxyribodipyrimidine photolyase, partial [Roseateles sp.]
SPTKQALDHDPEGFYRRRWLPEFGTPAYPAPIVDETEALARAQALLFPLRRTAAAASEAEAIQQRHGSRKAGLPATSARRRRPKPAPPAGLGQLF